jgi:oligoribonuclease NrnB/cAMP/cGMP phosphodiesterase (DHH superfamily)
MKNIVLYHKGCDDGFGGAWVAHRKFGDDAIYIGVVYGEPIPETQPTDNVYIIDFSYPRDDLIRLAEHRGVVVLDHHKTAERDLGDLPFAKFDMEKSGAMLAWEYFCPTETPPMVLRHIEDRDLWRFALKGTMQVSSALRSYPQDFGVWDDLMKMPDTLFDEGVVIERAIQIQVERIIGLSRERSVGGHLVPVANATCYQSEVGEALCERFPGSRFSATYMDRADGKRVWSLRSPNGQDGFDVGSLAKTLGGGGHHNAAGFTTRP